MAIPLTPLSIWVQLASFCFLSSGLFTDLLVIRLFLLSAYIFLFLNAVLGGPLWPNAANLGYIEISSLVWACLNLYTHGQYLIRLTLDEAKVKLTDDEDALWRMLYRLGGVSRKIFKHEMVSRMTVVHAVRGKDLDMEKYFYILYKGSVELEVYDNGKFVTREKAGSGAMFDFRKTQLLHETFKITTQSLVVRVLSDSTLFQFSHDAIREVAQLPNLKSVWQTVFLGNLAAIVNYYYTGKSSFDTVSEGFVDPLFLPLSEHEEPNPLVAGSGYGLSKFLQHIGYSAWMSLQLPWPLGGYMVGIRQGGLSAPSRQLGVRSSVVSHPSPRRTSSIVSYVGRYQSEAAEDTGRYTVSLVSGAMGDAEAPVDESD